MKPIRILIVEDRSVIAESLITMLVKHGYFANACASGEEALELITGETPDIILMDIQLSGKMDGIQTVEKIKAIQNIPVIYLTDFQDEKTIERAKRTNPANYLLKPFKEKDLLIAIDLAFYNSSTLKTAVPGNQEKPDEDSFLFKDRFFVKDKDMLCRIDIADILWVKADRAYYEIKTVKQQYTLVGNLNLFHQKFSHPLLMRVHRSYIVNMDKVTALKGNLLVVGDKLKAEIPISETYRDAINNRFQKV